MATDNIPSNRLETRPELTPAILSLIADISKQLEFARATVYTAVAALRHQSTGDSVDVASVLSRCADDVIMEQIERLDSITGVENG
jgi:hypothetical protein